MMKYRFRLTFHCRTPGFFKIEQEFTDFQIDDELSVQLTARDADTLSLATQFHFDAGGFQTEELARESGERLRLRLRLLNSMLDLGISVPVSDKNNAGFSEEIKENVFKEHGGIVMDSILGLSVYPDDEKHFEYVIAMKIDVNPSAPVFLLTALKKSWPLEIKFEERTLDALEIISHATTETSVRTKFLLMYLAVERIVKRASRSDAAKTLIQNFIELTKSSELDDKEKSSLVGTLTNLNDQSFPSALFSLIERIENPIKIQDAPMREFMSECVKTRNKLAHNAALDSTTDLNKLSAGLRQFAMMMIWTINRIPDFSVDVPASAVSIVSNHIRIR
jgi:hypothetical protein